MKLTGKKALVTGSSRGIGRGIALELARQGAAVAVNYRSDLSAAEEVVAEIEALSGLGSCLRADVCDPREARRLVTEATCRLGGLDILVNNVGEFFLKKLSRMRRVEWERVLNSNLSSVFTLINAALPIMRRQGGGSIVNIGFAPSDRVRGAANVAAYNIAKTGVLILTRSYANEEARSGVRLNCVSPGLIDNGFLSPQQKSWMEKRVPMGRMGSVAEVANAVAFLASDDSSYVSGANLAVAGGWDWEDRPTDHDGDVEELFDGV
jgi:3-oxoacyl-[acyl-carrier protein] reductase